MEERKRQKKLQYNKKNLSKLSMFFNSSQIGRKKIQLNAIPFKHSFINFKNERKKIVILACPHRYPEKSNMEKNKMEERKRTLMNPLISYIR